MLSLKCHRNHAVVWDCAICTESFLELSVVQNSIGFKLSPFSLKLFTNLTIPTQTSDPKGLYKETIPYKIVCFVIGPLSCFSTQYIKQSSDGNYPMAIALLDSSSGSINDPCNSRCFTGIMSKIFPVLLVDFCKVNPLDFNMAISNFCNVLASSIGSAPVRTSSA